MSDPLRVLIVEGRFYDALSDALLDGAAEVLRERGVQVDVATVPGALEIPPAIAIAEEVGRTPAGVRYDGYVALGVVIRGETYHFEIVSNESAAGITRVALDYAIPIANGVLTTEDEDQAFARAAEKGADAARVAIEMANLADSLSELATPAEDGS